MAIVKNIAKITSPRVQDILPRPRLFTLLETQRAVPVVWIYGPPGAGKTTLVASYFAHSKQQCLWYRVDAGDNDAATFFYYANLAVNHLFPKRRINLPLYTAESSDGFEAFARSYFRQLFSFMDDGAALVFDNCHELLTDAALLGALAIAAEEIPLGNRIFCISRNAPPLVFSKLQMYDQCRELDWQALRFTMEESRALLQRLHVNYPEAGLAWLHEKTRGWVSGLILLARNSRPGDTLAVMEPLPESSALFGYLASEVFEKLSPEICEFLMIAALLPEMTAASVQELTGHAQAQRLLNELAGKGYFLECSAGAGPVYQFHPLCRDFLLARGRICIDSERIFELQLHAAQLLDKQGNVEQAIDLYRQLRCWPELKKLLLAHAEDWICCGRHRSLIHWLEYIPESAAGDNDFCRYWLGIAYIPVDAKHAYALLEQAHESFLAQRNAEWSYRTWSAIVETICFARDDFGPLQKWIGRFSELRELFPYFFVPELKAKVCSSAVLAMSILDTQNPWLTETVKLSEYAVRLVPIELFQQAVLINLAYYYNFTGNLSRFRVFAPKLKKALDNEKLPPAARILAAVMLMLLAICNDDDEALTLYDYGIKLAEQTGVYLFNGLLYGFNIYHYALRGELKIARQLLEQANDKTPPRFTHDFAHYSQIAAWLAALDGDTALALEHNSLALDIEEQLHYPFGIAMTKDLGVQLLAKQRRWAEAEAQLEDERRIVDSLASKCLVHKLACTRAWLGYLRNDEVELIKNLRSAFAIGRAEQIMAWYGLLPEVLLALCCKALEYGIEVEYARQLIRIYKLFPQQAPLYLENWPWVNHFYAFGQFTIMADGRELEHGGKTPLKVLELLQVIIAFGGTQVEGLAVSEMLWPDSDGDNAQQALETALFRLRKLVGKDSITVSGGKISLNKKRCWLDIWAFEQQLEQLDLLLHKPNAATGDKLEACQAALSRLYRGPLFGEVCPPWAEAVRTRLQNKYHKALKRVSAYYEHAENGEKAEYFLDKLAEAGNTLHGGFYLQ
jgi:ATP/maltotriose-dependent transcriptional regulator MalT